MKRFTAILIVATCACLIGCSTRGVKVVASAATQANIGNVDWDEYKLPILSIWTGPRLTVWVNKDYLALKKIEGSGCVTNDTSALGIYHDYADKKASVEMEFQPATNLEYSVISEVR